MTTGARAATVAWVVTAVYYFYQYTLRSAPAVMIPELSQAFGVGAMAVASIAGLFYWGYAPFSLVAGAALDRVGPRRVVPLGAAAVGLGALLFASGSSAVASAGRVLQGAGGVFALVGAVYIASTWFPASRAATLIGATQMFGMAGGSAGQFLVGPLIGGGTPVGRFWLVMGLAGLAVAVLLYVLLPAGGATVPRAGGPPRGALRAMATVLRNPQSILCGVIAGLLFIPTTIFDMTWGVRYLQDARGYDYASAVMRSASVPLGWMVGCPLLGFVADRLGRRKPAIAAGALGLLACLALILYGPADLFPPYVLGLAAGIASGAAMLPYTVIKEANPPEVSGTATGVVNFLNFALTALLGPVFAALLRTASSDTGSTSLTHYQTAFQPLLVGVALALVLLLFLRETGTAAQRPAAVAA